MSFNKIIVVGNLGRDPEMRYTPQGTPICNFSIASNERRKASVSEEQPKDIVTWFRVTVWDKQAEVVSQYLSKGKSVYVEGRLHTTEWTDKEGKTRYTLEINASDVRFLESAHSAEGIPVRPFAQAETSRAAGATSGRRTTSQLSSAEMEEDSIPF